MRATLIHNAKAGGGEWSADRLVAALGEAGCGVSAQHAADDPALADTLSAIYTFSYVQDCSYVTAEPTGFCGFSLRGRSLTVAHKRMKPEFDDGLIDG